MPGRPGEAWTLRPWLQDLEVEIALAADRGQPIVLELAGEPRPHVARLMAALGVPIVVGGRAEAVTRVSAQEATATRDCVRPGCTEFAEPGLAECRRHADVGVLRARREHAENGSGLAALEAMDAGEPQTAARYPADIPEISEPQPRIAAANRHTAIVTPPATSVSQPSDEEPKKEATRSAALAEPEARSGSQTEGSSLVAPAAIRKDAADSGSASANGTKRGQRPERKWTPDLIHEALRAWAGSHGGLPPAASDWTRSTAEHPSAYVAMRVCGQSWAEIVRAAGLTPRRPGGAGAKQRPVQERQTPPIVWAVKVNGTGLKYRTPEEAYVAADEIEHDGERVAREARISGNEGRADQAIDASRELAEKIREAARECDPHAETASRNGSAPAVEPTAEPYLHAESIQLSGGEPMEPETRPPSASPAATTAVSEASREPAVGTAELASLPEPPVDVFARLGLTGDFAASSARVREEAARLRAQADALDAIARGIDQLGEAA